MGLMAEIMDVRYPVKGLYVWFPFGFDVRKRTYAIIRELLDKDHKEALFPLLIPENEFMKEAEHIKGFENEVYWVTHGGKNELEVKLALRPTSETAIYPMYKVWVRSHADLPILIYQIVNTFRYETKHTRPLIRLREITSFKEAHTVHATWDEAAKQVEEATRIYQEFYRRLAIPTIVSKRPEWDKFPGADYTMAVDTLMPDNKTLQIGTAHHLGSNFAKTFDIKYEDINGEQVLAQQTCYGISERSIAALISIHGDDKGLVFPPEVAPTQVVVIPIIFGKSDDVITAFESLLFASHSPTGIFHIGSGQGTTLREAITLVEKITNKKIKLEIQPFKPGDTEWTVLDTNKLKAATGWKCEVPLEQGLRRMWEKILELPKPILRVA